MFVERELGSVCFVAYRKYNVICEKTKTQYDYSYNNMSNPSQVDANDNEHSQS